MDDRTLVLLINTLNRITVSGKENLAMLLGCINQLEEELKKQEGGENATDRPAK